MLAALLLLLLSAAPASPSGAAQDSEIIRLVYENFKEPPLSQAQKEAVVRFVREADPAHKRLLPDFLRQHLDEAAKRRFLEAAPDHSKASDDFYDRAVEALNAALGDRGYMRPLKPLERPAPLPPELDTPHLRLMAKAMVASDARERVRLLGEAIAAVGALDLRLSSALAHAARADAYMELREVERAFDDLTTGLILYPDRPLTLHNRAVAALMLGLWGEAARDASRLIELRPDLSIAYTLRGSALDELGDYAGALRDFDKAVALDPADFWARLGRGTQLALRGRPGDSLDDFNAAVRLSSGVSAGYNGLGYSYLELGRHEAAARMLRESIRLDPEDPSAHAGLAIARLRGNDAEAGRAAFARAVELEPLFEVSAASVALKGRRWVRDGSLQTYRFTPSIAESIDELIRLLSAARAAPP